MFKEKEDVPAMSIAAVEKKYHCVIEVNDKSPPSAARYRQALLFDLFFCLSETNPNPNPNPFIQTKGWTNRS